MFAISEEIRAIERGVSVQFRRGKQIGRTRSSGVRPIFLQVSGVQLARQNRPELLEKDPMAKQSLICQW